MMREGYLDAKEWRLYADEQLRRICLEDGMSKFRAWYVYRAVRIFGKFTCKPRKNPRGKIITICLMCLLVLLLASCSTSSETTTLQLTKDVVFTSTIKRNSFLYWTRASGVIHTTPFTTTSVNNIETQPDPNSIDAVSDLGTSAFLKVLRLF